MISDLSFNGPALIMAIVNCNKDSFYPLSRAQGKKAVIKALKAEKNGADIIDFGAESSRPGSFYISEEEELSRLIPVIEMFRKRSSLPVSVDTRKAAVAKAALHAGADIINDISSLADDPNMGAVCAQSSAWVVLMHKKGEPYNMQDMPSYGNLKQELKSFFSLRIKNALASGISPSRIILDPGIGFGKSLKNNLEILNCLDEIFGKDYPLLVGLSRKSFIGELCATGQKLPDPEQRLAGTLAANSMAITKGAKIIRVHDVKEHADLAKVLYAIGRS